ncbi:unnamed protein product [Caenorhabditis sp. 36 PRJEB53466]|nr:unnamed protein product [Caenorhabditis sp. 36 PRJEB53466]
MNSSLIPFACNETFEPGFEVLKYLATLCYLGPGLYLHVSILWTIVSRKTRKLFGDNSFFRIYATDSIASSLLILDDIVFNRFFLYIPPLCPLVGPFFWSPSLIMKIAYQILHHSRFAKSVAQIFLVLNRMTCVLMPEGYTRIWRTFTPIACCLVAILPFGGTWNILISRNFGHPVFGGFTIDYIKAVPWAALSLFQSIYILTALFFTVICTSITLYKLIFLPDRIKSAEKSLCFTSIFISSTFLLVAGTQSIVAICVDLFFGRLFLFVSPLCPIVSPFFYRPSILLKTIYYLSIHARLSQCIAQIFLVLNRMSCIVFPTDYNRVWKTVTPISMGLIALGPFTSTWNTIISRQYVGPLYGGFAVNYIKAVQWAAISLFQSIYILTALFFTVICSSITLYKLIFLPDRIKSAERSLCFTSIYISFSFLLVAATQSLILIFLDVFFGRLFLYVPPLCPIVGPYFWTPSILLRLYYCAESHARFAKSVAQIFMVLNRMTCVLVPTYYSHIWRTFTPISLVIIVVLPFGGTWSSLISPRFFAIPASGGFAVIYTRVVSWVAPLSLFQSIYILTALFFTAICSSITLYKLIFLPDRIKSAEKSLCFTSIFISSTFLLVAGTQLTYVFCSACQKSDFLYNAQFLAFDTLTVGSGVIMLLTNSQLKVSICSSKTDGQRVFQLSSNKSVSHTGN